MVVKLRAHPQITPGGLMAEAMASLLALDLDLPVPPPYCVQIERDLADSLPDETIRNHFINSVGPNFGTAKWSPGYTIWPKDKRPTRELRQTAMEIFAVMVWKSFKTRLEERHVLSRLHSKTIAVEDDEVTFPHAWKNQKWHCMETLSFDLMQPQSIKDKAHAWLGRMTSIKNAKEAFRVCYLVGEPQLEGIKRAFEQALNVLHKTPVDHEIVRERDAEGFADTVARRFSGRSGPHS